MTPLRVFPAAVLLGILLAPVATPAQSRQDLQILEDLRMLQEQVQLLRSAIAALAEQAKATNARLDAQADLVRTLHADDKDALRNLQAQVDALAEKMSLYSQQVSRFGAEIPSVRASLDQQQKLLDRILATVAVPAPTAPGDVNTGAPAPAGTPLPASPGAAFRQAKDIYFGGDYELAAKTFAEFLQKFPDAGYGADANFWMGMAHFKRGNFPAALTAFSAIIENYSKTSDLVPDAYFEQGECYRAMGKPKEALAAYDAVIKQFPESNGALLAKTARQNIK